jgi:hypothetical protein
MITSMRKDSVNIEGNTPLFQKTRWALKQGNMIVKIALFVGSERRDAPLACLSQCTLMKREVYGFQVSSAGTDLRFFINPVQDNQDHDILGLLCMTICVHQVVVDDNLFVRRR